MKNDFQEIIFNNECTATMEGSAGWAEVWILRRNCQPAKLKLQKC